MKNTFEAKKAIVEAGKSRIYSDWSEHQSISKEDFISGLEWLCADPCDAQDRLTRELGCAKGKLWRLKRVRCSDGSLAGFYTEDGKEWGIAAGATRASISMRDSI